MNAIVALCVLDGYIVDVWRRTTTFMYSSLRSNHCYKSCILGTFPEKSLYASSCFCTFKTMEHGFPLQLSQLRACMPETSAGWAHWLPAGSLHTWNMALLDFPNVTGPNGSNSDNKKNRFRRFGMLRVMFSPILQLLLFQWICLEQNVFWASVNNVMILDVAIPSMAAMWKSLHNQVGQVN